MWIESICIRGFGRLVDRKIDFPLHKATLIIADNEQGKSTLAAALLAGLCGLPRRKSRGETIKLLDVYKPWKSDNFSVQLIIETNKKKIVVERDFARDGFEVRDYNTNQIISSQFSTDLCDSILKIPKDDFQRIAIITGKEIHNFNSSPNLQARLSAIVDGTQDNSSADIAIAALRDAKYVLNGRPLKPESAISRLKVELDKKRQRMYQLDKAMEEADEVIKNIKNAQAEYEDVNARIRNLDLEYKKSRLAEIREQIRIAETSKNEASALQKELDNLKEYANFPFERRDQLNNAVARMREQKSQIDELNKESSQIQQEIDSIKQFLDSRANLKDTDGEDIQSINTLYDLLKAAISDVEQKKNELELERSKLQAEGLDFDGLLKITQKLDSLPADKRKFLLEYRENDLKLSAELSQAQAASEKTNSDLQAIKQKRDSTKIGGKALTFLGASILAVGLGTFFLNSLPLFICAGIWAISLALTAKGAITWLKADTISSDEKARLEMRRDELSAKLNEIMASERKNAEELSRISDSLNYATPELLMEAISEYQSAISRYEPLKILIAQLEQAEDRLSSTKERAYNILQELGIKFSDSDNLLELLDKTRNALINYNEKRRRFYDLDMRLEDLQRKIDRKKRDSEEEYKIILDILSDAGINVDTTLEAALFRFDEAYKQYQRYKKIKDDLLPATGKNQPSDDTIEKLKKEETDLIAEIGNTHEESLRPLADIENERQELREQADKIREKIRELENEVAACVANYKREYPQLQEETRSLEKEYRKATRFDQATKTAAEVMADIANDTHRRWANALNSKASDILSHFKSDYADLKFDSDLRFTLRVISEDKIIQNEEVDAALSTGAKDQIYLAVRLACCEELSSIDESIPIILDDPFIACDDRRFISGFKYLAEHLAKKQQVLILSCHKNRHEILEKNGWLSSHVNLISI